MSRKKPPTLREGGWVIFTQCKQDIQGTLSRMKPFPDGKDANG